MKRILSREIEASPTPYATLIIKYAILALYGVTSCVVGVTTLDVVAGQAWGLIWPALVALLSTLALVGVIRSRVTGREGFELISTLLLVALLGGYVAAIIIRTMQDGEVTRLPIALLPLALSIYPAARMGRIARTLPRAAE